MFEETLKFYQNFPKEGINFVDIMPFMQDKEVFTNLIGEIEKVAAARDLVQDILLEVNIGREEAKSGFAPDAVFQAAEAAMSRPHVRVRGLMTIPPADADRDANMRYFDKVRALYVDINTNLFHNELKYLSMGMSGDYEDAIRTGATMVRVGTAIFGARHYNT